MKIFKNNRFMLKLMLLKQGTVNALTLYPGPLAKRGAGTFNQILRKKRTLKS